MEPAPSVSLGALFEANACLVAQAGFRVQAAAYIDASETLRNDERLLRGTALIRYGLYRYTRLMAAARAGDAARCTLLVSYGAEVNARDAFGRSALCIAVAGGHNAAAAALRGAGAAETAPFAGALVSTWAPIPLVGADPDDVDPACSLAVLGGGRIAVGNLSGAIRIRDTTTGALVSTFYPGPLGRSDVGSLASLHHGKLASAYEDGNVRLWDTVTGALEAVLPCDAAAVESAVTVLFDGRLASASYSGAVRLWDVRTRACTATLAHSCGVLSLAPLHNGGVVAGLFNGACSMWTSAGRLERTVGDEHGGCVFSVAELPDGRLCVGNSIPEPNVIRVWTVKGETALDVVIHGHEDSVKDLVALPDGRLLSASDDHTIKVWGSDVLSLRGGGDADACAATLEGHTDGVSSVVVLPDLRVVSAGGVGDGTVRVWQ